MKLKLIALAAMLAAAGAANAAIDVGTDGAGDFFFSIWDDAKSYSTDLNLQQNVFTSNVAAPGSYSFNLDLAADTVFQNFLSTANLSQLKWNISSVESQGVKTIIDTYSVLPATTITNDLGRTMTVGTGSFATAVSQGMTAQGNANSAVFSNGSAGYANNVAPGITWGTNHGGILNFNNTGTLANNSYASGLGLVRMAFATTGIAPSIYTPVVDSGTAARAYLDSSYTLNIAAVPEPETYAMLLAGLGLMGAIARRRQNKA